MENENNKVVEVLLKEIKKLAIALHEETKETHEYCLRNLQMSKRMTILEEENVRLIEEKTKLDQEIQKLSSRKNTSTVMAG